MRALRNQVVGLKVVNQADSLTLEIYDILGMDFFGEGITAKSVSEALNGSKGPVNVRINSPGGDAFEGVAIYNVLRSSGRPINVSVDGLAASAASVVAMAGDSIEMGTGSMLMIHPAMMLAIGDAAEMRKAAEVLDSVTNSLADIYTQRTKNEKQQVLDWMNAETWMNPQEAIDNGFADKMSETKAAVTNQFDLSIFKNTPERLKITNRDGLTKKVAGENLTADDFIYVGDPQNINTWHLPWRFSTEEKTQSHLRDALARFDQTAIPPTKKAAAKAKLMALCKEHGIDTEGPGEMMGDSADRSGMEAFEGEHIIAIHRKRIELLRLGLACTKS